MKHLFLLLLLSLPALLPAITPPVISEIHVLREEIFDEEDPLESTWPYRMANSIHVLTKEQYIRSILLFAEGDLYDPLLLEASERRLRESGFFNPVSVKPVILPDGRILVEVHTRDTWTLNPGIDFSSYSGEIAYSIQLEETNFLGWGKKVIVGWEKEVEQNRGSLLYQDSTFIDPLTRLATGIWKTDDGEGYQFILSRRFFSRTQVTSFRTVIIDSKDRIINYWQGEKALEFTLHRKWLLGEYWQRLWFEGDHVLRGGVGYSLLETNETLQEEMEPGHPYHLSPYHKDRMGYFTLEASRERYIKTKGFYAFDHDEDFFLGPLFRFGAGFSPGGVIRFYGETEIGWGRKDWQSSILGVVTREHTSPPHSYYLFGAQGAYHWTSKSVSSFGLRLDGFLHPQSTEVLYLDSEEGLRGIPYRELAGSRRAQFSIQHKILLIKNVLHLANLGVAAFADIGKVWGLEGGFDETGWETSIGAGVRIENLHSGFSTLSRLDVGYDLERGGWEIVLTTGEWFDWRRLGYRPTSTVSPSHATWWAGQ